MTVKRGYRFATVPEWVLFHAELQPVDVRVFGVLDRYANKAATAWPGLAKIGALAQCSEDTARRAIRRLEAVGAVTVEPGVDDAGRQTSNRYHLAADAPMHKGGSSGATPVGGTDARVEGGTAATQKRARRNESQKNEPVSTRTHAAPPAPRSVVALAAPNSDIARRELVPQVLDFAAQQAREDGRPLLPSERAALSKWVGEVLGEGYDATEVAHAISAAAYRTPKGVAGQIGKQRTESTSVGNRGLGAVGRFLAEGEPA